MRPASSPDSPTASGPCTLMDPTMSRLTFPTSTIRAMSSVSESVTRRPSRNSGTLPSRSMSAPIWGPPPCTTTGSMPIERRRTTSSAKRRRLAVSSPIALPPYFATMILPAKRRMYGKASHSTAALMPAGNSAVTTRSDVFTEPTSSWREADERQAGGFEDPRQHRSRRSFAMGS